jgi:histidine ammonia-lyase
MAGLHAAPAGAVGASGASGRTSAARPPLVVDRPAELDAAACLEIADGRGLRLTDRLIAELDAARAETVAALESGGPVYGVTTGMGAASTIVLDEEARAGHQARLLIARATGSEPWLGRREVRAALAVRLRTFLSGDAGVSSALCLRLVDVLRLDLVPAVPATRLGTAGEIVPLAHLGAAATGAASGELLTADGAVVPAQEALAASGLDPHLLAAKEGVALIEGVPVTTGRAIVLADRARRIAGQALAALAAELELIGANRDPFRPVVARADETLAEVLVRLDGLLGAERKSAALQSPVSFRVSGPGLAHLERVLGALDAAVVRALDGVTDSPARLDGAFVGTAGFDGFDLAASLDAVRFAVLHLAELGTARLHRLLDGAVTGLPRQLSSAPGAEAGMVTVHKRAVGTVHGLLTAARPASLGVIETSLGQEDAQSFSLEAAELLAGALDGLTDVVACELLAVLHARRLRAVLGGAGAPAPTRTPLDDELTALDAIVPDGVVDRPFGRDVAAIVRALDAGARASRR